MAGIFFYKKNETDERFSEFHWQDENKKLIHIIFSGFYCEFFWVLTAYFLTATDGSAIMYNSLILLLLEKY